MMNQFAIALCFIFVSFSYGIPLINNQVGIFGGHTIPIEDVPYMASLRVYMTNTTNTTEHICGASIIDENFLLSAGHCIFPGAEYEVLVGTDDVNKGGERYNVEIAIAHENFSFFKNEFDISLIKVSKPIVFGPKVAKIILADNTTKLEDGAPVDATGWGLTKPREEKLSTKLLETEMPLVSQSNCSVAMEHYAKITDWVICAGGKGEDTCQGDSGGPLTLDNVLIGITSFGIGCGSSTPGIYTSVPKMRPWIAKHMKNNE